MHKKIRLIQKGQAGFQFVQQGLVGGLVPTTAGSVLDQNTINAINQQQTNIWKVQQSNTEPAVVGTNPPTNPYYTN